MMEETFEKPKVEEPKTKYYYFDNEVSGEARRYIYKFDSNGDVVLLAPNIDGKNVKLGIKSSAGNKSQDKEINGFYVLERKLGKQKTRYKYALINHKGVAKLICCFPYRENNEKKLPVKDQRNLKIEESAQDPLIKEIYDLAAVSSGDGIVNKIKKYEKALEKMDKFRGNVVKLTDQDLEHEGLSEEYDTSGKKRVIGVTTVAIVGWFLTVSALLAIASVSLGFIGLEIALLPALPYLIPVAGLLLLAPIILIAGTYLGKLFLPESIKNPASRWMWQSIVGTVLIGMPIVFGLSAYFSILFTPGAAAFVAGFFGLGSVAAIPFAGPIIAAIIGGAVLVAGIAIVTPVIVGAIILRFLKKDRLHRTKELSEKYSKTYTEKEADKSDGKHAKGELKYPKGLNIWKEFGRAALESFFVGVFWPLALGAYLAPKLMLSLAQRTYDSKNRTTEFAKEVYEALHIIKKDGPLDAQNVKKYLKDNWTRPGIFFLMVFYGALYIVPLVSLPLVAAISTVLVVPLVVTIISFAFKNKLGIKFEDGNLGGLGKIYSWLGLGLLIVPVAIGWLFSWALGWNDDINGGAWYEASPLLKRVLAPFAGLSLLVGLPLIGFVILGGVIGKREEITGKTSNIVSRYWLFALKGFSSLIAVIFGLPAIVSIGLIKLVGTQYDKTNFLNKLPKLNTWVGIWNPLRITLFLVPFLIGFWRMEGNSFANNQSINKIISFGFKEIFSWPAGLTAFMSGFRDYDSVKAACDNYREEGKGVERFFTALALPLVSLAYALLFIGNLNPLSLIANSIASGIYKKNSSSAFGTKFAGKLLSLQNLAHRFSHGLLWPITFFGALSLEAFFPNWKVIGRDNKSFWKKIGMNFGVGLLVAPIMLPLFLPALFVTALAGVVIRLVGDANSIEKLTTKWGVGGEVGKTNFVALCRASIMILFSPIAYPGFLILRLLSNYKDMKWENYWRSALLGLGVFALGIPLLPIILPIVILGAIFVGIPVGVTKLIGLVLRGDGEKKEKVKEEKEEKKEEVVLGEEEVKEEGKEKGKKGKVMLEEEKKEEKKENKEGNVALEEVVVLEKEKLSSHVLERKIEEVKTAKEVKKAKEEVEVEVEVPVPVNEGKVETFTNE